MLNPAAHRPSNFGFCRYDFTSEFRDAEARSLAFFILLEKMMLEITTGSLCRLEFHPHRREPMDLMVSLLAMSRELY